MYAIIMAGGRGTRFWPKSREQHPKQLLNIYGNKSLIQNTVARLSPLIPTDRMFVVSTEKQLSEIRKQLPLVPENNYIVEPLGKNTAPCIGLSALFLDRLDPESVMVVLPADHLITSKVIFHKVLKAGAKIASERESLVTIGIQPSYPSTGYGYIQFNQELENINGVELLKVKTFAEKPNLETAKRFLKSGDFLWNSGIFIWKTKTILKEIEENIPELYDGLLEIGKALGTPKQNETINRVYRQIRSISIDYGVMENAKDVVVLKGDFEWNDLGTWDEVYKLSKKDKNGNVLLGKHLLKDSNRCFIDAPEKCVAVIGLDDLMVVDTDDAILICPRHLSQDVKDIVDIARSKRMTEYL
ncbi:MAG: mannose-1-phosphate guanylyltransferase [bacterium]